MKTIPIDHLLIGNIFFLVGISCHFWRYNIIYVLPNSFSYSIVSLKILFLLMGLRYLYNLVELTQFIKAYCAKCEGDDKAVAEIKTALTNEDYLAQLKD